MKLIDDWKEAYKWASTRCMAAAGILQATWLSVPEDIRTQAPAYLVSGITIGLLVLGIAGRVTKKNDDAPVA